jgi:hypothetical protein
MSGKPYITEDGFLIEESDPAFEAAKTLVVWVLWRKAKKSTTQVDDFVVKIVAKLLKVDLPT